MQQYIFIFCLCLLNIFCLLLLFFSAWEDDRWRLRSRWNLCLNRCWGIMNQINSVAVLFCIFIVITIVIIIRHSSTLYLDSTFHTYLHPCSLLQDCIFHYCKGRHFYWIFIYLCLLGNFLHAMMQCHMKIGWTMSPVSDHSRANTIWIKYFSQCVAFWLFSLKHSVLIIII